MAPPMRQPTRWLNHSLPQTLQIAVFFLYFDAALSLLFGGFSPIGIAMAAAAVGCGWGIANEKKVAWYAGIALAAVPFVLTALGYATFRGNLIGLMIAVARLVLLIHPESRNHVRIWFK